MNIFTFLLDNIYIVIIVGGFLLSLLGKSGGQKKPQNRMPTFGGEQEPAAPKHKPQLSPMELQQQEQERQEQQRLEAQRREQQRLEQQARQHALQLERQAEYEARQREQELEQREAEAEAKRLELGRRTPAIQSLDTAAVVKQRSKRTATASSRLFDSSRVNADELRKAVVWAEVLGPPRAKKPYR